MEDEEFETLDSENEEEEFDSGDDDTLDTGSDDDSDEDDADKYRKLYEAERKKNEDLDKKNAQLYARTKKLTGDSAKKKPSHATTDDDIRRVLEERDLEELDLVDDLKSEVADYAKLKGISVKKASQSPYIQFRKDQYEAKRREEDAAIGSKTRTKIKKDFDTMSPSDFDMSTEAGRADFSKYEDHLRKKLG